MAACSRSLILRSIKYRKFNACLSEFTRDSSTSSQEDIETHTGQKWDKDDYRMARFMESEKLVNPNFSIKLIDKVPPKQKEERVVWCDGETGSSTGHPRVYINLDKPGNHACGYCGLRFYKDDDHH